MFTIVFLVVSEVANTYAAALNSFFKTSTSKPVEKESTGEEEDTDYFPSDYSSSAEISAYGKAVSEEVEAEGLVLLKNENAALPLSSGDSVSAVLQTAYNFSYGSSGSGAIDSSRYTDFKTALEQVGLNVNSVLWDFYAANPSEQEMVTNRAGNPIYKVNALSWNEYSSAAQNSVSSTGGTAIAVVGRLSGEGNDLTTVGSDGYDGSYLSLTEEEISVLAELTKLKKSEKIDNIVVIINTASAINTAFLQQDWTVEVNGASYTVDVDACMWVGNVGIGGIYAVADALVGEVNPSGRLTDTYVNDNFSSPAMASWMLQNESSGRFAATYLNSSALNGNQKYYGVYVEGIYVGYRYYETRYEDYVLGNDNVGDYDYSATVSRSFGYGLSYTDFEYSDYSVEENEDGDYEVSVKVTNTGKSEGKETVQVYLQKPYTEYDVRNGVEKASVELVGFKKTDVIEKGDYRIVTVTVERENLKTYDANGYETYILEEGDYYLAVGTSAHDALNNMLAYKGRTKADDGMDYDGNSALAAKIGEDIRLDYTLYSVSETGTAITNRLDDSDINKYEGSTDTVKYVSRSDWAGTFPTEKITLTATATMIEDLASNKDIEEDPSASMPIYGAENGLTLAMLRGYDYDYEAWERLLDQMTWKEQEELVCVACYGTALVPSVGLPETSAEDGPTGVVSSEENISFPSEGIWAATFNTELIQKVGDALAEDARNAGNTAMYLPGINIHRTPYGGRTHEYFSEDPCLSAVAAEYEIKGVQSKGVTPYVKHYAFNDEEDNRIGVGKWLNEQSARELYLKPFGYAVSPSHGNAHGVMSSFNRSGCIWTSADYNLMTVILRDEFGFDGVVITDMALNQETYMTHDAFAAGTDLWLTSKSSSLFASKYSSSTTFRNYVRESVHRYLYVICNYSAAMNGVSSNTEFVKIMTWWQIVLLTLIITFFVLSLAAVAFTVVSYLKPAESRKTPPADKIKQ